jgi:hypothetical protein
MRETRNYKFLVSSCFIICVFVYPHMSKQARSLLTHEVGEGEEGEEDIAQGCRFKKANGDSDVIRIEDL